MLYPGVDLTTDLGPDPGEDFRVVDARNTGRARLDDADDGAEFLVPVSLGGPSARPEDTPVIRVVVHEPGWTESGILRSWLILLLLGLALLAGALVLAHRLGRSFVQPIRALASYAGASGATGRSPRAPPAERPTGGPPAQRGTQPPGRTDPGAPGARTGRGRRELSPASHAHHDLAATRRRAARQRRP